MKVKIERASSKLRQDVGEISVHKKLYKSGKQWLIASAATTVFGFSMLGVGLTAQASTTIDANQSETTKVAEQTKTNNLQNITPKAATTANLVTRTKSNMVKTASTDTATPDTDQSANQSDVQETADSQTANQITQTEKDDYSASQKSVNSATVESPTTSQGNTDASLQAQVTNLGNAKDEVVAAAKTKAEAQYEKTGQAQVITQTDPSEAPISGVNGTAPWTINDGVLTISSGNIDGTGTLWSSNKNDPTPAALAITSVKIAPNAKVTVSGNGAMFLFNEMPNVKTIDLTGLDTSAATSMKSMFEDDENLTSIIFGDKFNTSNVTSMKWMFANCGKLTDLKAAENFDTSKVTDMYGMFEHTGVNSLDLSHYDTSNVTTMGFMLRNNEELTSVDVSSFDTSHVNDFSNMFSNDTALPILDISNFNMKNVVTEASDRGPLPYAGEMFNNTPNLWKLTVGPNVVLTNSFLAEAPGNNTPLPGSSTAVNYNHNWQIVGSGSDYAPAGAEESLSTVIGNYSLAKVNSGEATKQTYVWAQKVPEQKVTNTYTVVNAMTGQPILPSEVIRIEGKNGDPITVSNTSITITINETTVTLPTNFYYATVAELKGNQKQPSTSVFGELSQSQNIYVIEAISADPVVVKTAVPEAVLMPPIIKTAVPTPLYTTATSNTGVPTPPDTPTTDQTVVPTPPESTPETPTSATEIEHGMVPDEPTTSKQQGNQTTIESDVDKSKAQETTAVAKASLHADNRQTVTRTQNAQKLPQTNESSHPLMVLVGLSMLGMFGSFLLAFSKKKRHDE